MPTMGDVARKQDAAAKAWDTGNTERKFRETGS